MFFLALMSVVIMLISGIQLLTGGAYLVGLSTIGFATLTGFTTQFAYKKFGYANSNHEQANQKKAKWYKKLDCCSDTCDCLDCS